MATPSKAKKKARVERRYHHGDLRNALVEQALALVEGGGIERFSLREAARLVGVSANAAYRHFEDRSDLLAAVVEVGFRRQERYILEAIAAVAETANAGAAAVERLKATGRGYVRFAVRHPELLRVMFGSHAGLDAQGFPHTAGYGLLSKALDALVAAGLMPAERRAGAELKAWTVVHGFAMLAIQGAGPLHADAKRSALLEEALDYACTGLCGRLDFPAWRRSCAARTTKRRRVP